MSYLQAIVPAEHASNHVLVVPDGTASSIVELAGAWFPDAGWLTEPAPQSRSKPMSGARFRGARVRSVDRLGPGLLGLSAEHVAAGPFDVPPERAAEMGLGAVTHEAFALGRADGEPDIRGARPVSFDDRDGIARAFASGLPVAEELRLVRWAVAGARKLGGAVLADGRQLLRPDPSASVALSLYSANALSATELLGLLRSFVATAELEARSTTPGGAVQYRLVGRTPYDGALSVQVEHVDRVPRSLGAVEWREYGPFAYHLTWVPQDPYELEVEQPSGVHVIARARMRVLVARLALLVQGRITGVLVDDGGFVATTEEVERRVDAPGTTSARAWV